MYTHLTKIVQDHLFKHVFSDYLVNFGDKEDGVIEIVGNTGDPSKMFEAGYYYGTIKPHPIIGISAMIGCPAKCSFCELGKDRFIRNLTADEMYEQVIMTLLAASRFVPINQKHKVNIAKSGEPLLNPNLLSGMEKIGSLGFSFKVSTLFPKGNLAEKVFEQLVNFARGYFESVQLQFSLISTSQEYRSKITGGIAASLSETRQKLEQWISANPKGRKPNASLILSNETPVDPAELFGVLPPDLINLRFRPYIETDNGNEIGLSSIGIERMNYLKNHFEDFGYTVSNWATPTPTEQKFRLSSNSTLRRYQRQTRFSP